MSTLTIRQVLDLPIFASSQLVAGAKGLDNIVHWVHVVDLTSAHYKWQRQGVLLLTSGLGFYENPIHQKTLVERLVRLGFAGLVLSTGHYFDQIPEEVRNDADRLGFPVIETPPDLLFIQITEVVLGHIVNQNYTVLQRSAQINQQLIHLVLQGGSWSDLVTTLAQCLQRSVAIELPPFQIIATAPCGRIDAAWERMTQPRSLSAIVDHLVQASVYESLQQTLQPQTLIPCPELGMTIDRMVAPIVVNQDIYGYFWLLAGSQPFTPLDQQALTDGATVAGLVLSKEQAVRSVEAAQQGDFLTQLLSAQRCLKPIAAQAQQLNYRLSAAHQVLWIQLAAPQPEAMPLLHPMVQQVIVHAYPHSLSARREDAVIVVLDSETDQGQSFAARLIAAVGHQTQTLVVGSGSICRTDDGDPSRLRRSYEQAQEAAHIGVLLKKTGAISFDELGLLHWVYHLTPEHRADNRYLHHVQTLFARDAQRHSELLDTLETYLDQGQSVAATAEALYIHRNTLLNRLDRIETLCHISLRDATQCLNLNVAIKSYRLHGAPE